MSDDDYKSSSPEAQLGGARRKNGHKTSCSCHICDNMKNKAKRGGYQEDAEKEMVKRMGGSNKKNGHKPNCGCPICKNMKNAKKKGGADEDALDVPDVKEGGRKKKGNGHKADCKCPICKNMAKNKKGGEIPDIENGLRGDIEEGGIPAEKKDEGAKTSGKEIVAKDDEYDLLDAAEKGEAGPNMVGGTRKRRGSRKSNGHKATCGCPICRNMKHGRKTRRHRKRTHRRR
jgi:hypothetical protein